MHTHMHTRMHTRMHTHMHTHIRMHTFKHPSMQASSGGLDDETITRVLHSYQMATRYKADSYKAWHSWALMNFTALTKAASPAVAPPHGLERSLSRSLDEMRARSASGAEDAIRHRSLSGGYFANGGSSERLASSSTSPFVAAELAAAAKTAGDHMSERVPE